jgi:hypothetical protein
LEGIEEDAEIPAAVGAEHDAGNGTWMPMEMKIKKAKLQYYTLQVSRTK